MPRHVKLHRVRSGPVLIYGYCHCQQQQCQGQHVSIPGFHKNKLSVGIACPLVKSLSQIFIWGPLLPSIPSPCLHLPGIYYRGWDENWVPGFSLSVTEWPWESHLTSLSLRLPFHRVGISVQSFVGGNKHITCYTGVTEGCYTKDWGYFKLHQAQHLCECHATAWNWPARKPRTPGTW